MTQINLESLLEQVRNTQLPIDQFIIRCIENNVDFNLSINGISLRERIVQEERLVWFEFTKKFGSHFENIANGLGLEEFENDTSIPNIIKEHIYAASKACCKELTHLYDDDSDLIKSWYERKEKIHGFNLSWDYHCQKIKKPLEELSNYLDPFILKEANHQHQLTNALLAELDQNIENFKTRLRSESSLPTGHFRGSVNISGVPKDLLTYKVTIDKDKNELKFKARKNIDDQAEDIDFNFETTDEVFKFDNPEQFKAYRRFRQQHYAFDFLENKISVSLYKIEELSLNNQGELSFNRREKDGLPLTFIDLTSNGSVYAAGVRFTGLKILAPACVITDTFYAPQFIYTPHLGSPSSFWILPHVQATISDFMCTSKAFYNLGEAHFDQSLICARIFKNRGFINSTADKKTLVMAYHLDNTGGKFHTNGQILVSTHHLFNDQGSIGGTQETNIELRTSFSNKDGFIGSSGETSLGFPKSLYVDQTGNILGQKIYITGDQHTILANGIFATNNDPSKENFVRFTEGNGVFPNSFFKTQKLYFSAAQVHFDPQTECDHIIVTRKAGQDFTMKDAHQTTGTFNIFQEGLEDEKAVQVVAQNPFPESSISLQNNLQANKGMSIHMPGAYVSMAKDILCLDGFLKFYVTWVYSGGVAAALNGFIFAPVGGLYIEEANSHANSSTLSIKDNFQLTGPLKQHGNFRVGNFTLTSNVESEFVASQTEIHGDFNLKGQGNLNLKPNPGSPLLPSLKISGKMTSDHPVTVLIKAGTFSALDKSPHISVHTYDVLPNSLPIISFGTGSLLSLSGLGGVVSAPVIISRVGKNGLLISPNPNIGKKPESIRPLNLEFIDLNIIKMNIPSPILNPQPDVPAFQFVFEERFWNDTLRNQEFYTKIKDHLVIRTHQGILEKAQGHLVFSLSPDLLIKQIEKEFLDVLKRNFISEGKPIDAAYVQELHKNTTEYLTSINYDPQALQQALVGQNSKVLVPQKPMIFYEGIMNEQGCKEYKANLYIPEAMINKVHGKMIHTHTLLIIPENLSPEQMLHYLKDRPGLQKQLLGFFTQNPELANRITQETEVKKTEPTLPNQAPVTFYGTQNIDNLGILTGGNIHYSGNLEAQKILLVSLFGNIFAETKTTRIGNDENFKDEIPEQVRLSAKEILAILAGGDIAFHGVETNSKLGTYIETLGKFYDVPVPVLEQKLQKFYGRWSGVKKQTTLNQHVSTHTSQGPLEINSHQGINIQASQFESSKTTLNAPEILLPGAKIVIENEEDMKRSKRGLFGKKKTSKIHEVHQTSQEVEFKGPAEFNTNKIIMESPIFHHNVTINAVMVQLVLGVDHHHLSKNVSSSSLVWQKAIQKMVQDKTYIEPVIGGTLTINAKDITIETIKNKANEFLERIVSQGDSPLLKELEEFHTQRQKRVQGPGVGLSALVAITATVLTGPFGPVASGMGVATLGSLGVTGLGATGIAMANAGFASLCAQASLALLSNEGNPLKAAKALASTNTLKNLGTSILSAGLFQEIASALDIPTGVGTEKLFIEHLQENMVRSAINVVLDIAINGQDFGDAILNGIYSAAAGTIGGFVANKIGTAYFQGDLNVITHKIAHAALGMITGAIISDDHLMGAISGAFGAVFSETMMDVFSGANRESYKKNVEFLNNNKGKLTEQEETTIRHKMNSDRDAMIKTGQWTKLLTATTSFVLGLNVNVANQTSTNAIDNNSCLDYYVMLARQKLKETYVDALIKEGILQESQREEALTYPLGQVMALHIHAFGPGTSQDSYSSKITEFALEFAQKSHQGKEELLKGKINFETVSKTGSSFVIKGVGGIGQACHKIRQDLENPNHHLFTQTGSSAAVLTLDMIEVANTAVNTLSALSTYKLTGKVGLAQDIGNITELLTPIALTKLSNLSKVTKVEGFGVKNGPGPAWNEQPMKRGNIIEKDLGQDLPPNYPVLDQNPHLNNGIATSIKSVDLRAKTYQDPNKLFSRLKGYIDELNKFEGTRHDNIMIAKSDIKDKVIKVAIPKNSTTPSQTEALERASEYAKSFDIKFDLIEN